LILSLYLSLIAISIILIIIGLFLPNHSEQALIGFFFLFLLSLSILNGTLEYETGSTVTSTYSYDGAGSINGTAQNIVYSYNTFQNHNIGYYLAIASAVGFIGVIFSIRRTYKNE
jgi:hypothetical protein